MLHPTKRSYLQHMRSKNKCEKIELSEPTVEEYNKRLHTCMKCGMAYKRAYHLKRHQENSCRGKDPMSSEEMIERLQMIVQAQQERMDERVDEMNKKYENLDKLVNEELKGFKAYMWEEFRMAWQIMISAALENRLTFRSIIV